MDGIKSVFLFEKKSHCAKQKKRPILSNWALLYLLQLIYSSVKSKAA